MKLDNCYILLGIFQTVDLIFIVILTTFQPICPSAFFRCFRSNSGVHTVSQTEPFISTTGIDYSNPVNLGQAQVFRYSKYLFVIATWCWDWTGNLVQIKGSVWDSVLTPEVDMKHLKKVEGHIGRNIVSITIKMRLIVQIF